MRLGYLQRLYPDARFVLAIRDPVWHIASLIKQQRLFVAGERAEPRALEHMRRVGHYEFGLDRRPINVGDDA
ncbi:sulfotransferase [Pseudomonas sp. BAY1663]|uniref:sulfotransferase n=1 Tax=Pseudomonas sp. BAY1663 TaxID=1439940 RepID=UPI00210DE78A|nr:sulfotransferase [Pseudomonas sp. BAY1663]